MTSLPGILRTVHVIEHVHVALSMDCKHDCSAWGSRELCMLLSLWTVGKTAVPGDPPRACLLCLGSLRAMRIELSVRVVMLSPWFYSSFLG